MKLVPELLRSVRRVIDLSGDFRLTSPQLYEQFYRQAHTASDLLSEAVYGLPELYKDSIANARLIANPGCYPTSVILAFYPALKEGIVSSEKIVVNSLSGVTGAGRTASVDFSFAEVNENIQAYKIGNHQHIPEIQQVLECATGRQVVFSFVPHLMPISRGIYTTIHADLEMAVSEEEVRTLYRDFYRDAPFIRLRDPVSQVRDVVRTNYCDIWSMVDLRSNKLVLISAIDNLLKGAAGQAVRNMNIMFGLPETKGFNSTKFSNRMAQDIEYVS